MGSIIFLDVDGTLVDYEGRVPASAIAAIRRARASGHRVYLSTGRSRAEVYDELWDIGLDGLIGANGGYVEDAGRVVLHQHLTADQCRRVVDWLHARGLEFYLESNAGLFASERFEAVGEPVIRRYAHGADAAPRPCSATSASPGSARSTPSTRCSPPGARTAPTPSRSATPASTSRC